MRLRLLLANLGLSLSLPNPGGNGKARNRRRRLSNPTLLFLLLFPLHVKAELSDLSRAGARACVVVNSFKVFKDVTDTDEERRRRMLFQTDPGASDSAAAEQRANSSGLCEMKGEREEEAVQRAKQKQNDNRELSLNRE